LPQNERIKKFTENLNKSSYANKKATPYLDYKMKNMRVFKYKIKDQKRKSRVISKYIDTLKAKY